jgi:hypothetical protein
MGNGDQSEELSERAALPAVGQELRRLNQGPISREASLPHEPRDVH